MANHKLNVQKTTAAGVKPAANTGLIAADVQLIPNDGKTILAIKNGSAEVCNVTVVTPGNVGGNPIEDKKVAIAAGEEKHIGPFPKAVYDNAEGELEVKLDKVATVTVSPISVG